MIRRQPHGLEQELARIPVPASVDMRWLSTIEAVEEQSKWSAYVGNGRHPGNVSRIGRAFRADSTQSGSRQREGPMVAADRVRGRARGQMRHIVCEWRSWEASASGKRRGYGSETN
jgi:hypothetical protein